MSRVRRHASCRGRAECAVNLITVPILERTMIVVRFDVYTFRRENRLRVLNQGFGDRRIEHWRLG